MTRQYKTLRPKPRSKWQRLSEATKQMVLNYNKDPKLDTPTDVSPHRLVIPVKPKFPRNPRKVLNHLINTVDWLMSKYGQCSTHDLMMIHGITREEAYSIMSVYREINIGVRSGDSVEEGAVVYNNFFPKEHQIITLYGKLSTLHTDIIDEKYGRFGDQDYGKKRFGREILWNIIIGLSHHKPVLSGLSTECVWEGSMIVVKLRCHGILIGKFSEHGLSSYGLTKYRIKGDVMRLRAKQERVDLARELFDLLAMAYEDKYINQ